MGYDGLELACWGDHFDVDRGDRAAGLRGRAPRAAGAPRPAVPRDLDPPRRPGGVRPDRRAPQGDPAAATSGATAIPRACASAPRTRSDARRRGGAARSASTSSTASPARASGTRSTPSRRPSQEYWEAGFGDFAERWTPILDAFDKHGRELRARGAPDRDRVRHRLRRARARGGRRPQAFGFNYDPSHLGYQGVDYVKFIRTFGDRIFHVHMKDVWWGHGDGTVGVFGGHTSFGDARRFWDFRSLGHGDIKLRGHHRRAQRRRLPGPAERRVGGLAHGPRARRDRGGGVRASGSTSRRRTSRSTPPSTGTSSDPPAALRHGRRWPGRLHRRRAPRRLRPRPTGCPGRRGALVGSDAGARVGARSRPRLRAGVRLVAGDARARARTPGG